MRHRALAILAACLVSLHCHGGEPAAPVDAAVAAERIAAAVQREFDADLFPGAVVLIGVADKVLYHEAFGHARVTPEKVPMQKDSIFDVASVTKVVATATAVGICKDRGLIDPDALMLKYLPDYTGEGAGQITLRHLGAHTSGFPVSPRIADKGKYRGDKFYEEMLKFTPKWPAGTRFQYACRNTILLSTMVERVTGKTFGDFVTAEVFKPLGMNESVFNKVTPGPRVVDVGNEVFGEARNGDGDCAGRAIGNGGLFTTAADLSRFCQMMLGEGKLGEQRILSPETVADFTRLNQPKKFPGRGFIWEVDVKAHHRPTRMSPPAYGHSGYTGMSIWIDPVKKVYTVVLTNRTHPKEERSETPRGVQQYKARGRIADAALEAFGF